MTPEAAVERLNTILAHAWMIRTFLKHAEEIQGDAEMLSVPRTLYDTIRAVEPARERGDVSKYLRRLKGKLPKLRRVADYFRDHYRDYSTHTNYEMASLSLVGVVRAIEEVFATITIPPPLPTIPPSPLTPPADNRPKRDIVAELDIPEV